MRKPRIPEILRTVAHYYDVSPAAIESGSRVSSVVKARHMVFLLCRRLTIKSLAEIGLEVCGTDHSTVSCGVKCAEGWGQGDVQILLGEVEKRVQNLSN